ncbi:MAG: hypothetical protein PVF84_02690 [Desulfuromonadales bacterium]
MKKYFVLIALWVVSIAAAVGGLEIYKSYQGQEFDKTAVPYIRQVIPEISTWDPETVKALMAPEVAATIPDEKFIRAMRFFSKLGALQSIDEPEFSEAHVDRETDIGRQTILEYKIDARYENDEAEINLQLLEKGSSYEIYRFNFSSELLLSS